ncbi:MAG: hypothetical protein U0791_13765 [Gemmataceae bacterium]
MLRAAILVPFLASTVVAKPTTFDGKHDITTVNLTVVYFVPKDRKPLPDWKDRVEYYASRIAAFHHRELDGISTIKPAIHPVPLVSEQDTAHFRRGDQNRTFFDTMDDVKALLKWKPDQKNGFPVLLVLSDINWRELDDFTRLREVNGKKIHEGNIAGNGRHFPGAESGGARATYIANPGYGMGLVSGDGWRVPYAGGSDCVAYHEGLGHSLGLPHPDPIDDTVMGVAQYKFWINEATLNRSQKLKLGWTPPAKEPDLSRDLFTRFTALQQPIAPKAGEVVGLSLKWPKDAAVKSFTVRIQTKLFDEWKTVVTNVTAKPPDAIPLTKFDAAGPVSYRVNVELADGQTAEIRGYFQVK